MRSLIIAIPLMLLVALVQSSVINRLGMGAARPNLALVLALAWTMVPGRSVEGLGWALVGGVALDLYSGGPFGAHALAFTLVSLLIGLSETRIWSVYFIMLMAVGLLGTTLFYLIYLILLAVSGITLAWQTLFATVILPTAGMNMLLIVPVYWGAVWLNNQLYPPQVEA